MNPLEPNDPLWNLLGKARKVEVRGNFVQNVVRAARQEPQTLGLWQRLAEWIQRSSGGAFLRPALVAAAVAVAGLAVWHSSTPELAQDEMPQVPALAASNVSDEDLELLNLAESLPTMPLESVNQMDVLLAMDSTSALTDTEIAFLLY